MTLTYDFDIFDVIPEDPEHDPDLAGFLTRIGHSGDTASEKIALFRNAATADALRDAPEGLRAYFLACGFGLNTYDSGAPRHRYPARDEETRLAIIARLAEAAADHDLPDPSGAYEGGDVFRLGAFLADLALAQPIEDQAQTLPSAPDMLPGHAYAARAADLPMFDTAPPPPPAPKRKFWQGRFFLAAVVVGMAVALLQISASFGVISLASL